MFYPVNSVSISWRKKEISSRLLQGEGGYVRIASVLTSYCGRAELVGTQSSFDIAQVSFEEGEYREYKKSSRSYVN